MKMGYNRSEIGGQRSRVTGVSNPMGKLTWVSPEEKCVAVLVCFFGPRNTKLCDLDVAFPTIRVPPGASMGGQHPIKRLDILSAMLR